ncbi:pyridoxine-5'-phosphate oxidase-like isoform X1 [Leptotrombidium deliense]|uniref:pyridoxal 5'-phosphate synthase n=1 Tax=Leptotrombidium deliense TaxID=299467 RepID=A0A443S2H3_9ACAR|nr:pyridoxine-5'-phosphate oxidase-like isoform X1 [Leptotrombidium deliense]
MAKVAVDLRNMRKSYNEDEQLLLESSLPSKNPILLFQHWFEEAKNCETIYESNAVCLSTCDKDGWPSSRMVLLKSFGDDGFKFFTNYDSRKGKELIENPKAALLFYWDPLKRQIRVEGLVEKLPESEAEEYFRLRPKRSQIAAAISNQSEVIESRDELIKRYSLLDERYSGDEFIPKPSFWGGFKLVPKSIEFWQGQSSRLHDRILFKRSQNTAVDGTLVKEAENGWVMQRLQP